MAPHPNKLNPKHLIGWPEKMKLTSRRSALFQLQSFLPLRAATRREQSAQMLFLWRSASGLMPWPRRSTTASTMGRHIPWQVLDEAVLIHAEIIATPRYHEGLYVKARAGCWALFGDLDADEHSSADHRTGLSIMRHESDCTNLERPGARKGLLNTLPRTATHIRQGSLLNTTLKELGLSATEHKHDSLVRVLKL